MPKASALCSSLLNRKYFLLFLVLVVNVLASSLIKDVGGDEEIRTPDPLLARQVLSQLSYAPIFSHFKLRPLSLDFVSFFSHVLYTLPRLSLVCLELLVLNVKIYHFYLIVNCTIKTAYHLIVRLSPRPISTSQLHTLLHFHSLPIYHLFLMGSYYLRMGYLILRLASCLDAFSTYLNRT